EQLRLQVGGDQADVLAGVGLYGDRDRAAAHLRQGGALVVDLDREQVGREHDDIHRVADLAWGQPGYPDAAPVGTGRDLPLRLAVEQRHQVVECGRVADLL